MNKNIVIFLIVSVFFCSLKTQEQKHAASAMPEVFNVGNLKIPTTEALGLLGGMSEALEEVSQETRNHFSRQFAAMEAERKQLGARKDAGLVGMAEYDQASRALDVRQKQLEDEMHQAQKNGQQFSNNMQSLFMSGWQMMLEHQHEEDQRKTKVAQAAVTQAVANDGALERFKFALRKDNLTKVGIFATAITAGGFGSYYGCNFLFKYLDATLGVPTLVRESSREGVLSSLLTWAKPKKQPVNQDEAFAGVILAPELKKSIVSLAKATAATHLNGLQYRHLLLYGPPGTGKTLIAKTLACASGMDYAIISGADFSQFKPGTDIQKLHEIFDWAEHGKRGLILFIDEAEALLSKRKGLSESGFKLLDAFLARTNASSQQFMLILATNYPENLDSAVLSRVNKKIEIGLPGADERASLLQLYNNKYLKEPIKNHKEVKTLQVDAALDDQYFKGIAQKINGFSGREIDQLLAEVRIEALISGDDKVSQTLMDEVVNSKIAQHQKECNWNK